MRKLFVSVILLFACPYVYSATTVTKTVCSSGCDYSLLNSAVTYFEINYPNFVTSDIVGEIKICGNSSCNNTATALTDGTTVGISGITTDQTRYLSIYTYGGARHSGTPYKSGIYKFQAFLNCADGISWFTNSINYTRISGLVFYHYTSGCGGSYHSLYNFGSNSFVDSNIIYSNGSDTGRSQSNGIVVGSGTYFTNNIIFYMRESDLLFSNINSAAFVIGNTFYYNILGASSSGATFKNNISYNNSTDYAGTYNSNSTGNLSKDNTAPAYGTYYRSKTLTFVSTTAGSQDFHLSSTDTDAIGMGVDLGSPYNTDIDGDTRSGLWDIGADESPYSTAATGGPSIIRNSIIRNSIIGRR